MIKTRQQVSVLFMLFSILFCVCLIAANILETKQISVLGISLTGGLIVFPISYIINDCVCEVWGFRKARLLIWTGFAMNFFFVSMGALCDWFPCHLWSCATRCRSFLRGFYSRFVCQCLRDEQDEDSRRRQTFLVASHLEHHCRRGLGFSYLLPAGPGWGCSSRGIAKVDALAGIAENPLRGHRTAFDHTCCEEAEAARRRRCLRQWRELQHLEDIQLRLRHLAQTATP